MLPFLIILLCNILLSYTTWKVPKYGVFSGPYFPTFGLNTERYSVRMRENTDQIKLHIWTLFTYSIIVDWILRAHFFIYLLHMTLHKKWSFPLRGFFSKCDQIRSFLRIRPHLLKKYLMKNVFCAVWYFEIFLCLGRHKWYQRPIWPQRFCYYLYFGSCCLQHKLHQQNILQFRKVLTWTKKWIYLKNCYVKSLQQQKRK